jgi:signal transduction histidine kinase
MMSSVSTSFSDEFIQAQDLLTALRGANQFHEIFMQNASLELRAPLALVMECAELLRKGIQKAVAWLTKW